MNNRQVIYQDMRKRAENIYEQYQDYMAENEKNENVYIKTKLRFEILESMEIGGQSSFGNNIDTICINSGTIDNFYDYFHEFSKYVTQNIFQRMDLSDDNDEESFENIFFDEGGKFQIADNISLEKDLATLLDIFVGRFILTHEFGHLFNGHCGYLNSIEKGKIQPIPFFLHYNSPEKLKYISALDYRTLEYDADAFAITNNLFYLIFLYTKFEEKVDNKWNIKAVELFFWWGFAITSVFLLMHQIFNDEFASNDMKYLPSILRWINVLNITNRIIDSENLKIEFRDGDTADKILKRVINGCTLAEKYFNIINNSPENWIYKIRENSIDLQLLAEVEENWNINMVEKLTPFSRLRLYKDF